MTRTPERGREQPLRRDAALNRDRLLAAAVHVFGTQGLDASVTEIARVAGVGMGTLYRHFPTKNALIDAVVNGVMGATIEMAHNAALSPDGTGLERFLIASSAYQAEHVGCLPRLWNTDHRMVRIARQLMATLLADAQDHGRIRADLTTTDVTMVMFSIRGVLETTLPSAPEAWPRHLDLLVAGMRPTDERFPHEPLSQATVDRILIQLKDRSAEHR